MRLIGIKQNPTEYTTTNMYRYARNAVNSLTVSRRNIDTDNERTNETEKELNKINTIWLFFSTSSHEFVFCCCGCCCEIPKSNLNIFCVATRHGWCDIYDGNVSYSPVWLAHRNELVPYRIVWNPQQTHVFHSNRLGGKVFAMPKKNRNRRTTNDNKNIRK